MEVFVFKILNWILIYNLLYFDTNPVKSSCCWHLCYSTRLHECDDQVSWVREGMAKVIPVPLLSLFTGYELETMVSEYNNNFNYSFWKPLIIFVILNYDK